jgi:hypothetical protein
MNDGQTDAALEQYKIIAMRILRMRKPICGWLRLSQERPDLALDSLKKAGSMVQD